MQIDAITPMTGFGDVERAHAALNAAYNAMADERSAGTLLPDARLAHHYVSEARESLVAGAGHDGPDDARSSARAVLPRIDHALALLDALAATADPNQLAPLLDELGLAMDHVEQLLAAAGWD